MHESRNNVDDRDIHHVGHLIYGHKLGDLKYLLFFFSLLTVYFDLFPDRIAFLPAVFRCFGFSGRGKPCKGFLDLFLDLFLCRLRFEGLLFLRSGLWLFLCFAGDNRFLELFLPDTFTFFLFQLKFFIS